VRNDVGMLKPSSLCALLLICSLPAPAQGTDTAQDPMARRMQVCAACHGREGRAASDGYYPRIAGKPAAYLYQQLRNFRERRRGYAPMVHLVKNLTEDYLLEIAGYFAALDLPYPPPRPGRTDPRAMQHGEALVQRGDKVRGIPACVTCHGESLTGALPGVPALLGLPRDYINAQLGAWQTGLRGALAPDCMARVAVRLSPNDIAALSMWLASQAVPTGARPAPAPARSADDPVCAGLPDSGAPR
jgi:cytochrome c553